MTVLTVNTSKNLDTITRAAADTFTVSAGAVLTIDGDTRYDVAGGAGLSLNNITIDANTGGSVVIDGSKVRLVPFTSGSGTATIGATITCGSATGKIIGIYSAVNVAPVLTGVATGWIKVKGWNSIDFPTSGTYTQGGYTFTISGADVAGWIEIVGDESATLTVPRLGSVSITGDLFAVGTTTGTATDTYQMPTNGNATYFGGCYVETSSAGVYDFYPALGSFAGANMISAGEDRGRVCWISSAGVLRLGYDGTNTIGYCPPVGRKIACGNVILQNCTVASRTVNAVPNATLGTRYDFTTTGGGAVSISKAVMAWYPSFANTYVLTLDHVAISDQLYTTDHGTPFTITRSGVGVTAAQTASVSWSATGMTKGGTATNCAWARTSAGASINFSDANDLYLTDDRTLYVSGYVDGVQGYQFSRVKGLMTRIACGPAPIWMAYCNGLTFKDTISYGQMGTSAPRGPRLFLLNTVLSNIMMDGVTLPDSNGWTTRLVEISGNGITDSELRNIGSAASPLAWAGSIPFYLTAGAYPARLKMRRVYLSGVTGYLTTSGGSTAVDIQLDNCAGGYAAPVASSFDPQMGRARGIIGTPPSAGTTYALAFGTHWCDFFTSATAGKFYIEMNEPSPQTASNVFAENGAKFTSANSGGLYMPVIGMSATLTMDYFAIGHTGFSASTLPVMQNATASNFKFNFQADVGSGWSAMSSDLTTVTALRDALAALTVDAMVGVKLRLKITTKTTNTQTIQAFTIATTSTTTTQGYQYPLEVATVTIDGLVAGSMCKASKVSDGTILFTGAESSGSVSFTTDYAGAVSIEARKASGSPYYRPWTSQITTILGSTVSATATQQLDE